MIIDPLTLIIVFILLAVSVAAAAKGLAIQAHRKQFPSIERRRKELEIRVKLGDITPEEYANQTMALDHESEEGQLRRRTK